MLSSSNNVPNDEYFQRALAIVKEDGFTDDFMTGIEAAKVIAAVLELTDEQHQRFLSLGCGDMVKGFTDMVKKDITKHRVIEHPVMNHIPLHPFAI